MRQTITRRLARAAHPHPELKPSWRDRARVLATGREYPLELCSPRTGCWVKESGDPLVKGSEEFNQVALTCAEHLVLPGGVLVRHADFAVQMDSAPGGAAGLLSRMGYRAEADFGHYDMLGVAIAGTYTAAAAIMNLRHYGGGEWAGAAYNAGATGTDLVVADRRREMYELLDQGGPVTADDLEYWDQAAATYDIGDLYPAVMAGYSAAEITPGLLADKGQLQLEIALLGTEDWFGAHSQSALKPYR